MGITRWIIKKKFKTAWKVIFGMKPKISKDDALIDVIPGEIERMYGVKIPTNKWNGFIDSINRLPRPIFTFWAFYLLVLPLVNVEKFKESMVAYAAFPSSLFYIVMTIIGFWFATKGLEKAKYFVNPKEYKKQLQEAAELRSELDKMKKQEEPPVTNEV